MGHSIIYLKCYFLCLWLKGRKVEYSQTVYMSRLVGIPTNGFQSGPTQTDLLLVSESQKRAKSLKFRI